MTDTTRNMVANAIQKKKELNDQVAELKLENTLLKKLCKEMITACDTINLKSVVIRPFLKIFKKHADLIVKHKLNRGDKP